MVFGQRTEMRVLAICLVLLAGYTTAGQIVRYDNYRVYKLTPHTPQALKQLKELEQSGSELDFWNEVRGLHMATDVVVPPKYLVQIENFINSSQIESELMIENVQSLIDHENVKSKSLTLDWTAYYTLDEINAWLESLQEQYPDLIEVITVGRSYEGRDIKGVKLSYSKANENNAIFLEANIHAREWITSAVCTYILNELLTSTDKRVRALAESHDWYVVPVFNPDGFQYTKTSDRLWRKTRVPYGILCYGADPNRNWGYHWNEGGSSSNPCSDTYNGPQAFSEPSTRTIAEYIDTISSKLVGYIAFHSYSQLLLIPYGYSSEHLDNFDELEEIGLKAAASLAQRYGTKYTVGNIVETIYIASGGSMDWVKGTYGTPVTYTYELRDTGRYGFLLPPEQIIPTGEETLDSLVTIFEEYDAKRANKSN